MYWSWTWRDHHSCGGAVERSKPHPCSEVKAPGLCSTAAVSRRVGCNADMCEELHLADAVRHGTRALELERYSVTTEQAYSLEHGQN